MHSKIHKHGHKKMKTQSLNKTKKDINPHWCKQNKPIILIYGTHKNKNLYSNYATYYNCFAHSFFSKFFNLLPLTNLTTLNILQISQFSHKILVEHNFHMGASLKPLLS